MRTVLVLMLTICLPHAALAAVDVNTATRKSTLDIYGSCAS